MSLGVKSAWRARPSTSILRGLSLIPGERPLPLLSHQRTTPRYTSTSDESHAATLPKLSPTPAAVDDSSSAGAVAQNTKEHGQGTLLAKKQFVFAQAQPELVEPAIPYSNKQEERRSFGRYAHSVDRQDMYTRARVRRERQPSKWRDTLGFLMLHTPKTGSVTYFKVVVDRRVAREALEKLSELDSNIGQIQRRTQCIIGIEPSLNEDGTLGLTLSGPEISVSRALLEIVKAVGEISTVRVLDAASKELVTRAISDNKHPPTAPGIRLVSEGQASTDDNVLTVAQDLGGETALQKRADRFRASPLVIRQRADSITPPSPWTKASFDEYISKLIRSRVPTSLHNSLYKTDSHQDVVASLLVEAFTSEAAQSAASGLALKKTLIFLQSSGHMYRKQVLTILAQAEVNNVDMDVEVFNILLDGAGMVQNLNSYDDLLKNMVRKGHTPNSETWFAFLRLFRDRATIQEIRKRMRIRGLIYQPQDKLREAQLTLAAEFERYVWSGKGSLEFVEAWNQRYGIGWLGNKALNQMLSILGRHGKMDECAALLEVATQDHYTMPSVATLNIFLTHERRVTHALASLRLFSARWPWISPDMVTYQILYSPAKIRRRPNMLRVIWRYASFAWSTSSKMRHDLGVLLFQDDVDRGNRWRLLRDWREMILGETALRQVEQQSISPPKVSQIARWYQDQSKTMQLQARFEDKLEEAYELDRKIHACLREGQEMTPSVLESLTVKLPLKKRDSRLQERSIANLRSGSSERADGAKGA